MAQFRLLDLFCGAGGAGMGYSRAGFEVVGVDKEPMKRYPFEFHQGDALEYLAEHGHEFEAIHASPPCQGYSITQRATKRTDHANLIPPTRKLLQSIGVPWVIENVMGAPMKPPAILLCGTMFGLRVLRHRWFESSVLLLAPGHPKHPGGNLTNSCYGYSSDSPFVCVAGNNFNRIAGERAMGIDWMGSRPALAQSIPPAYTKFIGDQLACIIQSRLEVSRGPI